MTPSSPRVSIIIVNYNGVIDTIECLESVLKLSYDNFNIIVVDNSQTTSDFEQLNDWAKYGADVPTLFPRLIHPFENKPIHTISLFEGADLPSNPAKICFIKAKENKGFAAANNIGVKFAKVQNDPDFYWFLNNDTVVEANCLMQLVNQMLQSPRIGIVGSQLREYKEPLKVQAIGGHLNKYFGTTSHIKNPVIQINKIDYPIGASILVSKNFISEVGLMCEDYFLYYEELDWVLRGKKKGFDFSVAQNAIVYHKEGSSTNANNNDKKNRSDFADITSLNARCVFMKKFFPDNMRIVKIGLFLTALNRMRRGNFQIAKTIIAKCI